jgi:hypothetical protein
MIYPRTGKDDKGNDKRVQMQGFMKEFPAVAEYMKETGSPILWVGKFLLNKLNPVVMATWQAATNHDYMGKSIGNLQQNIEYWLRQSLFPIPFEQDVKTLKQGGNLGDLIMNHLGFTPSGRWTTRSDADSRIIQTYLGNKDRPEDVMDARDAYQRAYTSGNAEKIEEARKGLDEIYQKEYHKPISDRILKNLQNSAGLTSGQKIFMHLRPDQQLEELKKESPEERKLYLPHASKKVQREFEEQGGASTNAGDKGGEIPEYAKPGPYVTKLSSGDEQQFQDWVKKNHIPWEDSPVADYDMRGYWKAMVTGDPNAKREKSSFDGHMHFPDTYKTPFHKTFSKESIYAKADAPHWVGDKLIDKNGKVIADETPR